MHTLLHSNNIRDLVDIAFVLGGSAVVVLGVLGLPWLLADFVRALRHTQRD